MTQAAPRTAENDTHEKRVPESPRVSGDDGRRTRRLDRIGILIALIVAAIYLWPFSKAGFVNDDFNSLHVIDVGFDLEHWTVPGVLKHIVRMLHTKASPHIDIHRPGVLLTYFLQMLASGTDPRPYQIGNIVLHLLAGVMLARLLRTLCPEAPPYALGLGVLLFLISPAQYETVSWTAARSETLSFICGAWALRRKLAHPDTLKTRILTALGVLAALSAKESALAFLGAVMLVDMERTIFPSARGSRPAGAAIADFCRRAAPLFIVFAIFAGLRLSIFGAIFGRYTSKSESEFLRLNGLRKNIAQSLAVLIMPVSEIPIETLGRRVKMFGSAWVVAMGVMWWRALVSVIRQTPRGLVAMSFVFIASLSLGVMVNPATSKMVGTRALYTPMAIVIYFFLAGMDARRSEAVKSWPLILAVLAALGSGRGQQTAFIETADRIRETTSSIWEAVKPYDDGTHPAIAIIGYEETTYIDGSFDMAVGITKAVRTPFTKNDYDLLKISGDAGALRDVKRLDAFFSRPDHEKTLLLAMRFGDNRRSCVLVHPGRIDPPDGGVFEPVWPIAGEVVKVDLNDASPAPIALRFRAKGFKPHYFALTVYTPYTDVPGATVDRETAKNAATGEDEFGFRIPSAALENFARENGAGALAWSVTALDAEKRRIAELRLERFIGVVIPRR